MVIDLPFPGGRPGEGAGGPTRFVLAPDGTRSFALWVVDIGLACCAVEFVAATLGTAPGGLAPLGPAPGLAPLGTEPPAGPRTVEVMVVSGTVTDAMAPAVLRLYSRMPDPKYVVSFGACANSGGPYWDSYSVTKGVDQLVPVDVYVPGCPPRPEALLAALRTLPPRTAAAR